MTHADRQQGLLSVKPLFPRKTWFRYGRNSTAVESVRPLRRQDTDLTSPILRQLQASRHSPYFSNFSPSNSACIRKSTFCMQRCQSRIGCVARSQSLQVSVFKHVVTMPGSVWWPGKLCAAINTCIEVHTIFIFTARSGMLERQQSVCKCLS